MILTNKNLKNKHNSDQQEPKEQAWFRPKRTSMIQTNNNQKNKYNSDQQEPQ